MTKLLSLLFLLLFALSAQGQATRSYSFTHYSTSSGLMSNQVNTVVQDDQGYIWAGTTDGLQRFDGTRYKTFTHRENDVASLPSGPVWQLLIDNKKNLWVLMSNGQVGIFNTVTYSFQPKATYFRKPVTPNTALKRLSVDADGHVFYLLSGSEVICFNEQLQAFSSTGFFIPLKEDWAILDLVHEPGSTRYWISIANKGLAVYNSSTRQFSLPGANTEQLSLLETCAGNYRYDHLFFDNRKRLWAIDWKGGPAIQCYETNTGRQLIKDLSLLYQLKTYHEIKGFIQQQDGSIWVHGLLVLAKFLEKEQQFQPVSNGYLTEQGIAYELVHCLYEDREKNIWVATDNNGLYRFNPATELFRNIKHINRINQLPGKGGVMSFLYTPWGTILSGSWGDGLYEYDKEFNVLPLSIRGLKETAPPSVWCMTTAADSSSSWLAAQPGIYRLQTASRMVTYYNPPLLNNATIRQLAEDKQGNLWLGTNSHGLFYWNAVKGKNRFEDGLTHVDELPSVQVNKITIDSKGSVWVGTPENGVYVIDPLSRQVKLHLTDAGNAGVRLPERGISSVLEYNDTTIIITTATRIWLYNPLLQNGRVLGPAGSISGFITAALKDENGYVWITSTNGLYRINLRTQNIHAFNRADGIDNEHFVQSAAAALPDGRLLFGSTDDILVFDPARFNRTAPLPMITITDIKIMGRSLPQNSHWLQVPVELGYQDNSLTIEFSPLLYNSATIIQYKMDKLDKYWMTADKNNQAVYNYLPPGDYQFLLKSVDEEGHAAAQASTLHIIVRPPFWKTWWFYSLLALATGFVLFWLDRERMRRKAAIQKMRSEIADKLYQDVHTALGNINILSEIARLKADKEPEKSKDYIQQIHSRSQQMMVVIDDMLWGMNPENDSMQKTIDRIKENIDNLRNHYNVSIDLLVDKNVEQLKLNMRLRQSVFWFFKTGISNIVKTGASRCTVHISFDKTLLLYQVEFDHTTADMQQLNNLLQRQELKQKLEEVRGNVTMRQQTHITIIRLSIPV